MKILINYADGSHYKSQKHNSETGLTLGKFDKVIEWNRTLLDDEFLSRNENIFNSFTSGYWGSGHRGAGYWIWKPYIIYNTLLNVDEDDIVFYSDAGASFVDDMTPYFDECIKNKNGLILFDSCGHLNHTYTKRDCFVYMDADEDKYIYGKHITASFHLCRKTEFALNFYKEFLDYCQDERIVTDIPNSCGLDNYPSFVDHRHDQSIASILSIKYDVKLLVDPSQWGNHVRTEKDLPQTIHHHRNKQ